MRASYEERREGDEKVLWVRRKEKMRPAPLLYCKERKERLIIRRRRMACRKGRGGKESPVPNLTEEERRSRGLSSYKRGKKKKRAKQISNKGPH